MELTKGGCSRGSTQWASGLRLNAIQPARNHITFVPCTVPPTSTNATGTEPSTPIFREQECVEALGFQLFLFRRLVCHLCHIHGF